MPDWSKIILCPHCGAGNPIDTVECIRCEKHIPPEAKQQAEDSEVEEKYKVNPTRNTDTGGIYIPKDLEDCFLELKKMLHPDFIEEEIKSKNEDTFTAEQHFRLGLWVRNNWELVSGLDRLSEYFNKLGIHHPDNMSDIILNSFHRHLNNEYIELEKQVESYQKVESYLDNDLIDF